MKTYYIEFTGRKTGALGVTYHNIATRTAENEDAAILALYDEFEHITVRFIKDITK